MNSEWRDSWSRRFREYADSFASPGQSLSAPQRLKIDHTFEVCGVMDRIAADETRRDIYWLGALFHDVARFEQYRDYGTFRDDRSFDHGRRGAEIFRRNFPDSALSGEDRERIARAIECHNRLALPAFDDPRTDRLARAVRDADKISILRILNRHFRHSLLSEQETVNLGMPDTPGFTEELARAALRGEPIAHTAMKNINDFKLTVFAWTSDFNFPASAEIVLDGKLYAELRTFLPESPLLDELYEVCAGRLRTLAARGKG